ncbi:MAG: hypothetical protein WBF58_02510, partial [Xanthobacteraceae bacterium]
MILSQPEIRAAVEKGEIRFDPPLEERQWGVASIDLRLGLKFAKLIADSSVTFSMTKGIGPIARTGLYHEEVFQLKDNFGKRRTYILEPNEFILALTHEHVWMPRNLIAMVEGRSTYARVGLSMHQTAPWIQRKPPPSTAFWGSFAREMVSSLICKLMSEHEHGDGAVRSGAAAT